MAANLPVWLGDKGLTEHPTSPLNVQDSVKTTITRVYEGPFEVCQAAQPTMGQTFSDLPGDVVVVNSTCAKAPGGTDGAKGRLTIVLETPYATTFETEWVEVDKPLILNPIFWDGSTPDTTPAGEYPLDLTDKSMIESWEHEDDAALKLAFQFKVIQQSTTTQIGGGAYSTQTPTSTNVTIAGYAGPFNIYTLSANAQVYAKKRLKGEEIYRIFAPVIRQTSESLDPPDSSPAGLLENPPTDSNPPTSDPTNPASIYVWQRSAKRVSRTGPYGKYRLQQEWQGADRIDTDLYGQSDDGTAPNPTS